MRSQRVCLIKLISTKPNRSLTPLTQLQISQISAPALQPLVKASNRSLLNIDSHPVYERSLSAFLYLNEPFGKFVVNVLRNICPEKMGKERNKREYDLRVLNCVSESEYESRMAVWNSLTLAATPSVSETKGFIDEAFNKLQQDLKEASRELSINYTDFIAMAHEELNYIKVFVADKTAQYGWYAAIVLMIIGTFALCAQ